MSAAPKLYTPSGIPGDWQRRSDDLAQWVRGRMLNRTDAFGRYKAKAKRDPGQKRGNVWTASGEIQRTVLQRHFEGVDGFCCGLHAIDENGLCRWLAWDVDAHDGDDADPAANLEYALLLLSRLRTFGFHALLLDSNGRGGFHLFVLFAKPIAAATAYRLGRGLVADCASQGVAGVETFPKQGELKGKGLGNWIRLPGLHHTHEHWTKTWDPESLQWREGEAAINALLGLTSNPVDLVERVAATMPDAEEAKRKAKAQRKGPVAVGPGGLQGGPLSQFQIERYWSALGYHDPNSYDEWIKTGLSLTELGEVGFQLWEEWSKNSPKFVDGECRAKWASFSPDGRGLGSLIVEAKTRGWTDPQLDLPPARRKPDSPNTSVKSTDGSVLDEDLADARTFANFTWEEGFDKDGEPVPKKAPLGLRAIQRALARIDPDWPKRVGQDGSLFVQTADFRPVYLDSPARLFAWVGAMAKVDWARGGAFSPQDRFYEHMRMNAEEYEAIETVPHFPPLPRIYYMHKPVGVGGGATIERFIRLFCPHTEMDRQLIRAMLLTLFWGGNPGSRPAFLITGPEGDRGRGIGKSTFVDILAGVGGVKSLDVSPTDQITDVKTRLLSAEGRHVRVARLDNVKALKLSWADLEGLITAREISGRMLFKGEGSRPNTVMWCITLNGASLSTDMAQRSIVLKLGRPVHRPEWENEVKAFVEENRDALLADIRAALEAPGEKIETKTRWAAWEREILGRCPIANLLQDVIVERQKEVDDDDEEMIMVADYFRSVLAEANGREINPDTDKVFIPASVASEWFNKATNQNLATNKAGAALKGLGIPELRYSKQMSIRGWIWKGKEASRNPRSFRIDKGIFSPDAEDSNV